MGFSRNDGNKQRYSAASQFRQNTFETDVVMDLRASKNKIHKLNAK